MTKRVSNIFLFARRYSDIFVVVFFVFIVGAFFYRSILFGKLPVPTDALVGLYHPYRDLYQKQYPNGVPFKNFLITDPVRQQIPWRKSVVTSFQKGKIPLWDAFSFAGSPLLTNSQTGAFYPLNIFFLIFPFEAAWTILIISQPLLAGVFLYWFLRRKSLDQAASLFGALCFAFSGFSVAWLTWGTMLSTWLWVPLSLLCIENIAARGIKKSIVWMLMFVMSMTSSFFAGHLQIFIYSVLLLGAYVLWITKSKGRTALFNPLLAICASVLIFTFPQWGRIVHFFSDTTRLLQGAVWQTEGFFIPIKHLAQFLAPDYFGNPATLNYWGVWNYGEMVGYIGIAGLIFAFVGVISQTLFWVLAIALSLVFSLASPISAIPYQLHIPFISSLQPTRLLVVIDFSLSILAAYGFSRIMKGVRGKIFVVPLLLIGSLLVVLWILTPALHLFGIAPSQIAVSSRNLVMPTIVFVSVFMALMILHFARGKRQQIVKQGFIASIIIIAVIDLFRFGWKFTPFTDSRYFFPKTNIISYLQSRQRPYRIMMTDDRIFPPNVNGFYGIESISGYDPVHSLRYAEFISAMERGKPDIDLPTGPDRIIAPINIHSPLLPLLNVRYILSFDQLKAPGIREVFREGKTIVYEKTDFLPRAYLVQHAVYKNEKQDIMNHLHSPDFDPKYTAIVEYPVSLLNFPLGTGETAKILSYEEDQMTIEVRVSQARLLIIGNMFDPGWRVYIDNKQGSIYRTNYLFMGVVVPTGSHIVKLLYK